MYDTAFRYTAASNTTIPWGKANDQLYNDILKEETLPYCAIAILMVIALWHAL